MVAKKLTFIFIITAFVYLASLASTPYSLQFAIKVLPILVLFAATAKLLDDRIKTYILAAVFFSGVGDVMLALPIEHSFIFGLSAFFIAQLIYAISFFCNTVPNEVTKKQKIFALSLVVYACGVGSYIIPATGDLMIPVTAYLIVISLMGIAALVSKLHWYVAMGALFFVASDSILATSIFRDPLPLSNYLVMATYYIAQYFIVFGLISSKNKS